jgi:hypothetical protein
MRLFVRGGRLSGVTTDVCLLVSTTARVNEMEQNNDCRVIAVAKRRDGRWRYWCLAHHASATAKYGQPAAECRAAHVPRVEAEKELVLDPSLYAGGVALWGAVPPLYDTTGNPTEHGIHVHARRTSTGPKIVDGTFRSLMLALFWEGKKEEFAISELDAIYYMASTIFGFTVKLIRCSFCGFEHLDKDWFSVHAHRRHLCAGCGKEFRDNEAAVGNPIARILKAFGNGHRVEPAPRELQLSQADYPGGVQIWGSNRAIMWTASKSEESGIHVHAYGESGEPPVIDDTYGSVSIDGTRLEPALIQILMAQSALPHIHGRVVDTSCPKCGKGHFDTATDSFTPHQVHNCGGCGTAFRSRGRLRNTIGNPAVGTIAALADWAVRPQQIHRTNLLTETL